MTYQAPVSEMQFLMDKVIGADRLNGTGHFADGFEDMTDAILAEAAKLAEGVIAPLNRSGDLDPAQLENGVVRTSKGFAEGHKAIGEGGWVGISASAEHGGLNLPVLLNSCVNEMLSSGCLALSLCPLLTQGQIEALEHHASDELKAQYLPKLISGEWTGTMNLTEPQAGSDVGALRTKAEPNGDGTYAISGQKIYITWGDHDFGGNVVHLVLARLPDAVPGTKGISLFVVPKYLPNADGSLGEANDLRVVSLEHKLGIHGSPTAVMEYSGAKGWMVGAPGGGMAAMFTMMNNARLGVGVQGISQAEAAYQAALAYALDRKQGRSMVPDGTGTIFDHADVRRMLMTMKVLTSVARTIALDTAFSLDMGAAGQGAEWTARGAFLTPIAKAFGTDIGVEVASIGIQVHGGMGFIEETGAAQYLRDARITPIYEGTNGIQAMDLVGRKMMDGGAAARALLAEIAATADADDSDLGQGLRAAHDALAQATEMLLAAEMNDRFAASVPYQHAFALTLGGHYLLKGAVDETRMAFARFFIHHHLPQVPGLLAPVAHGAAELYALDAAALGA
ncbi:acyl-CoA dehydrogenase [Halovulum sp. GXIMD14793]